ncbi:hypothetical protein [Paracoccus sp. 08]|uniref:hypothetical protein n=1 Tax=Paracoccus sp. 08 TaxID=2606624 RepID=UPI0020950B77|nr:hypothetical protein [Paracoccus sp. 08]
MERFGTGRPAVHEALQHLHTMVLITISHGERSRVNALSADSVLSRVDDVARMLLSSEPDQLDHLKQARRMFECGLVRMAAQTATEADVADLRALIAAHNPDGAVAAMQAHLDRSVGLYAHQNAQG